MLNPIAIAVLLLPATAACLSYFLPTLVGIFSRRRTPAQPTHSFLVLVPAHNEQTALQGTLQNLAVLDYPPELIRVVVVADNCTDHTAAVARWGGATCLVRHDPEKCGKGHAVAFGLERFEREPPDVVLILDADCHLHSEALRELDAVFAQGADAIQCAVLSQNGDSVSVGAALDEVRARGLDCLGFSTPLLGTGMAFRHVLFHRAPWCGEPREYRRRLRKAGVQVRRCEEAVVTRQAPPIHALTRAWWKPVALVYLVSASVSAMALGSYLWPATLILATALLYLRAVLAVRVERGKEKPRAISLAAVVQKQSVKLTGLARREVAGWEGSTRENEQQAA
jgi:cellulose synthase/poly-beta-1,6-N-acetylglucosamine synthase-like glycosyltransferase